MQEARIIRDSVMYWGGGDPIRCATFFLCYPKFIHGEFMTHRRFSRNASSSRAVPTARLIEEVRSDAQRAAPVFWGKNQKGMQAVEELDDKYKAAAQMAWQAAAEMAATHAEVLVSLDVHKQIVNRVLEPFLHINVVCTATEYMNFFGLRLDRAAQPEIRALAEAMWRAWNESTPKVLKPGDWHLPFIDDEEDEQLFRRSFSNQGGTSIFDRDWHTDLCRKVSAARCARVSYKSFDTGKRSTLEEDLKLYDRLLGAQPFHASPAEHQATPDEWVHPLSREALSSFPSDGGKCAGWQHPEQHGNLFGFRQYRKMLPGEDMALLPEEYCPGHVASKADPKVCGRCGVHVDSFRPSDDEEPENGT